MVDLPLFPGYLFCRFDVLKKLPILQAPGVIQVVGNHRQPVPVDETEINAIRQLVASGIPNEPWPYLEAGDRVRIWTGPLQGLEGLLVAIKGSHRLVLAVTLLQRAVAVEVDRASVQLLESAVSDQERTARKALRLLCVTN